MDDDVLIYALVDPRTEEIRYVGQTRNPHQRYRVHLNVSYTWYTSSYGVPAYPRDAWVLDLRERGFWPRMKHLEWVRPEEHFEAERRHIAEAIERREPILNLDVCAPRPALPSRAPARVKEKRPVKTASWASKRTSGA